MLLAKELHITAKRKRMVPSAELLEFFFFLIFFSPFSIILGEDSSREDLMNTPSGKKIEITKFGWFGCQGKVV